MPHLSLSRSVRPYLALVLLALASLARAQPATNAANGAVQAVSPEVAADRSITFRLYAPNAKSVTLHGDFYAANNSNGPALVRGENGVWTITIPPQPAGVHGYYLRVDGLRLPDPSNLALSTSTEFLKSYVEVPGEAAQFAALRDVPHGELHEVFYKNSALGQRRVIIYTPPGYDPAATRTYPALYLLHSTTDTEVFWTRIGRAHLILDNLLAEGKARPMLLVMPFGHTSIPRGPEEGAGGNDLYDVSVIGKDIVENIIPLLETRFHAGKSAADRAIFGMAMGGYQAITIGMNYTGTFGYVTASSANFRANMDLAANFKSFNADAAKRDLRYFAMMAGTAESGSYPQSTRVVTYFNALGVKTDWMTPEGSHTWHSWRGYLREMLEKKFFAADPYAAPKIVGAPPASAPPRAERAQPP
jgi:enterochelin esterase-like enzyme